MYIGKPCDKHVRRLFENFELSLYLKTIEQEIIERTNCNFIAKFDNRLIQQPFLPLICILIKSFYTRDGERTEFHDGFIDIQISF